MSLNPLVSVYIPTKNRLDLLKRALNSVINQTYPNIEILVADDGSTDGTQAFLLGLLEGQPENPKLASLVEAGRVQVILASESKGACHARNQAIARANGVYITGLDDDDEFLPEHVQTLLNAYEKRKASCVSSSQVVRQSTGDVATQYGVGTCSLDRLLHTNAIGNQVFTQTNHLRAIGGFDESMVAFQDYDTWVRLVHKYGAGYKVSQATYVLYTEHADRISAKLQRKQAGWQKFQEKHRQLMSTRHIKSQHLIKLALSNTKPSLLELMRHVHAENWRVAVNLYFRFLPLPVKRLVEWLRRA